MALATEVSVLCSNYQHLLTEVNCETRILSSVATCGLMGFKVFICRDNVHCHSTFAGVRFAIGLTCAGDPISLIERLAHACVVFLAHALWRAGRVTDGDGP